MIIINLTDLQHVPKQSPLFIRFRQPYAGKALCGVACRDAPHYRCTRSDGHDKYRNPEDGDHAAHGVDGKMFARWNNDEGEDK